MKIYNIYEDIVNKYLNTDNLSEKAYLLNLILETFQKESLSKFKLESNTFNGVLRDLENIGVISSNNYSYLRELWRVRNGLTHSIYRLKFYLKTMESHSNDSKFREEISIVLNIIRKPKEVTLEGLEYLLNNNNNILITNPIPEDMIKINPYRIPNMVDVRDYCINKNKQTITIDGKVVGTYIDGEINLDKEEVKLLKDKHNIDVEI